MDEDIQKRITVKLSDGGAIGVAMRQCRPGDQGLILDSWKKSIRTVQPYSQWDWQEIERHKQAVIEPLLLSAPPMVACHPDHPDQVFGWVCARYVDGNPVLHMLYVRGIWRRLGIGRRLASERLPGLCKRTVWCSHWTATARKLSGRWMLKWNPHLAV